MPKTKTTENKTEQLPAKTQDLSRGTLLALVSSGDTSGLSEDQHLEWYRTRCSKARLDPSTIPFRYITTRQGESLYATKEAAAQLTARDHISTEILKEGIEGDQMVVLVRATCGDHYTDDLGVVPIDGLRGDAAANARMKAITKAKRRAILFLRGLGVSDESEADTMGRPTDRPTVRTIRGQSSKSLPAPAAAPTSDDKLSETQFKRLHALGTEYYGDEWNARRPELCSSVSRGRTKSSKDLTVAEAATLVEGIKRRLDHALLVKDVLEAQQRALNVDAMTTEDLPESTLEEWSTEELRAYEDHLRKLLETEAPF